MKLSVHTDMVVRLVGTGGVQFTTDFIDRAQKLASSISQGDIEVSSENPTSFSATFRDINMANAVGIKTRFLKEVTLLAEHGENGDLLQMLISRYPDLESNPKLPAIVGAFDNLVRLVNEAKAVPESDIKLHEQAGGTTPEMLSALSPDTVEGMNRAEFREACLRKASSGADKVKLGKPVIPEIYDKLKGSQRMPGDEGNVFSG